MSGVKVKDTEGGPGLAFIAYTTAVAEMPLPQLWAASFFFMMVTLALNSEFGTVEALITPLRDFKIFSKMRREVSSSSVNTSIFQQYELYPSCSDECST